MRMKTIMGVLLGWPVGAAVPRPHISSFQHDTRLSSPFFPFYFPFPSSVIVSPVTSPLPSAAPLRKELQYFFSYRHTLTASLFWSVGAAGILGVGRGSLGGVLDTNLSTKSRVRLLGAAAQSCAGVRFNL